MFNSYGSCMRVVTCTPHGRAGEGEVECKEKGRPTSCVFRMVSLFTSLVLLLVLPVLPHLLLPSSCSTYLPSYLRPIVR